MESKNLKAQGTTVQVLPSTHSSPGAWTPLLTETAHAPASLALTAEVLWIQIKKKGVSNVRGLPADQGGFYQNISLLKSKLSRIYLSTSSYPKKTKTVSLLRGTSFRVQMEPAATWRLECRLWNKADLFYVPPIVYQKSAAHFFFTSFGLLRSRIETPMILAMILSSLEKTICDTLQTGLRKHWVLNTQKQILRVTNDKNGCHIVIP